MEYPGSKDLSPHRVSHEGEDVIARLGQVTGLDAVQGLRTLSGKGDAYARILRHFASSHGGDMARLRERLAAGDRAAAHLLAHSLKGAASNLGATQVRLLSAELEAAIRAGADPAALAPGIEALERAYQQLSTDLLAALGPVPSASAGDRTRLPSLLNEIQPLLAMADASVNRLVAENAALLTAALGPTGEELTQRVARFEYAEALELLRRWREQGPG